MWPLTISSQCRIRPRFTQGCRALLGVLLRGNGITVDTGGPAGSFLKYSNRYFSRLGSSPYHLQLASARLPCRAALWSQISATNRPRVC
jgi:hypothetical protein